MTNEDDALPVGSDTKDASEVHAILIGEGLGVRLNLLYGCLIGVRGVVRGERAGSLELDDYTAVDGIRPPSPQGVFMTGLQFNTRVVREVAEHMNGAYAQLLLVA